MIGGGRLTSESLGLAVCLSDCANVRVVVVHMCMCVCVCVCVCVLPCRSRSLSSRFRLSPPPTHYSHPPQNEKKRGEHSTSCGDPNRSCDFFHLHSFCLIQFACTLNAATKLIIEINHIFATASFSISAFLFFFFL